MLIKEVIEQFLIHCKHTKKLSTHTIRAYTTDLESFLEFSRNASLPECDRVLLRNYLRYLFEKCGLKETTVKRRFACLKAMFRWMEVEEIIQENPFRKIDLNIKLPSRLPRGLSEHELQKLLNTPLKPLEITYRSQLTRKRCKSIATDRLRFRALTTLICQDILFATGIRVGELAAITLEDIDLQSQTIKIHGKGDRERLVFLPNSQLSEQIASYLYARECFSSNCKYLIITTRGTRADTQYIRILIRIAGEEANITRRITPHMLRHSTATHLLNSGIDIRFVQKLLGHQSITTTQIYTQVGDAILKQVVCDSHPIGRIVMG